MSSWQELKIKTKEGSAKFSEKNVELFTLTELTSVIDLSNLMTRSPAITCSEHSAA